MMLTLAQRIALGWLALALGVGLLAWWLGPVLTPFVLAVTLAYALTPAVDALHRRARLPRALAVLVVELAAIAVIASVLLLIVPILSRELPQLREQIPVLASRLNEALMPWLAQHGVKGALDVASIKDFVVKHLSANLDDGLAAAFSSVRIGGSFLLALAGNAVLVPVVLFYVLLDWDSLLGRLRGFIPPRVVPAVEAFVVECDDVLGQYLRGQVLVMALLAVYYAVALGLAKFDLALPVGVFTGLAIAIPYVGFGLGAVLALLASVLQFGNLYGLLVVAVVYGVGQVIESFVLTPRLVGERIGLHPLAVIFALLAFGHVFGFVGVLVALPAAAISLVAGRRLRSAYLASGFFRGV